jgi:hypothetical protein
MEAFSSREVAEIAKKICTDDNPALQPFRECGILLNNKQRLPRIMTLPRKVTIPS